LRNNDVPAADIDDPTICALANAASIPLSGTDFPGLTEQEVAREVLEWVRNHEPKVEDMDNASVLSNMQASRRKDH
jgi:hypothetical protein